MASSPSAAIACRLWPSPAGIPPVTNTTTSSPPLPGGLLTVSSASMVSSLPFWQSRTSPFPGRSLLLNPICSSRDPGEMDAIHVANSEQPQGGSIDSRSNGKEPAKSFSSKELLEKLKRYGVAGVLSYGILNTIYYTTTFVLVWFYFSPAPGGMGYPAAVERFLKLIAMVWAGSQVTKILRAGGALALAPFVDRGLRLFTVKFNFESEGKAFAAIVGFCFALAVLLFFGLTLLWA